MKEETEIESEAILGMIETIGTVTDALKCVKAAEKYTPTIETAIAVLDQSANLLGMQQLWSQKIEKQLIKSLNEQINERSQGLYVP